MNKLDKIKLIDRQVRDILSYFNRVSYLFNKEDTLKKLLKLSDDELHILEDCIFKMDEEKIKAMLVCDTEDLDTLTNAELREIAVKLGIKNTSRMNKYNLILNIEKGRKEKK